MGGRFGRRRGGLGLGGGRFGRWSLGLGRGLRLGRFDLLRRRHHHLDLRGRGDGGGSLGLRDAVGHGAKLHLEFGELDDVGSVHGANFLPGEIPRGRSADDPRLPRDLDGLGRAPAGGDDGEGDAERRQAVVGVHGFSPCCFGRGGYYPLPNRYDIKRLFFKHL